MDGQELKVWVDTSSLGTGVALERHKTVLEEACWLRPENNAQHINLAKLDARLKAINLALQRQGKVLYVKTDCMCVSLDIRHFKWESASEYQGSK